MGRRQRRFCFVVGVAEQKEGCILSRASAACRRAVRVAADFAVMRRRSLAGSRRNRGGGGGRRRRDLGNDRDLIVKR